MKLLGIERYGGDFAVKIRESHGLVQREGSAVSHVKKEKEVHSLPTSQVTAQVSTPSMLERSRNIEYLGPDDITIPNDELLCHVFYYTEESAVYPDKKWTFSAFKYHGTMLFLIEPESPAKKIGDLGFTDVVMLDVLAASSVLPFSFKFVLEPINSAITHSEEISERAFMLGIKSARSIYYET